MIKITNVYDNIKCENVFIQDWGFGCVIDYPDKRIIFDTGARPEILEKNLKFAQVDPSSIDIIIISHKHWDHKGGLLWLVKQNPNVKIYLPKTLRKSLEKSLIKYTKEIYSLTKNFSINDKLHLILSKNFWISELVLAIKTSKGIIIITGCSHTGIHQIVKRVYSDLQDEIYALFGGFHLFRSSTNKINKISDILKEMEVKVIAPCHCTGDKALKILKKEFSKSCLENGVGIEYLFEV